MCEDGEVCALKGHGSAAYQSYLSVEGSRDAAKYMCLKLPRYMVDPYISPMSCSFNISGITSDLFASANVTSSNCCMCWYDVSSALTEMLVH